MSRTVQQAVEDQLNSLTAAGAELHRSSARATTNLYPRSDRARHNFHRELIGTGEEEGYRNYMSLYPKFSRNSYVLLYNTGHVFIEFWIWLQSYNERHSAPWDLSEFNLSASAAFQVMAEWDVDGRGNQAENRKDQP